MAGLIVLCGIGAIYAAAHPSASGTGSGSGTDTGGDGGGGSVTGPARIGQPVRDGKFEFTVTKVQCGIASVGDEYVGKKAQGQFCEVSVTVKNIGDEARLFDASNVYAYNAASQKYDADGGAGIYLGDKANSFLNNINPGNVVQGIVVFDIPKNQKITKIELHDSTFSGGATVTV